jgi:hypothetical protein
LVASYSLLTFVRITLWMLVTSSCKAGFDIDDHERVDCVRTLQGLPLQHQIFLMDIF